jgi:hypothetical protein
MREVPSLETLWLKNIGMMGKVQKIYHSNDSLMWTFYVCCWETHYNSNMLVLHSLCSSISKTMSKKLHHSSCQFHSYQHLSQAFFISTLKEVFKKLYMGMAIKFGNTLHNILFVRESSLLQHDSTVITGRCWMEQESRKNVGGNQIRKVTIGKQYKNVYST